MMPHWARNYKQDLFVPPTCQNTDSELISQEIFAK